VRFRRLTAQTLRANEDSGSTAIDSALSAFNETFAVASEGAPASCCPNDAAMGSWASASGVCGWGRFGGCLDSFAQAFEMVDQVKQDHQHGSALSTWYARLMLELVAAGPFSWIRSSEDAPPRIFDVPESRKCGVYLFTVPTAKGHLIYWVGQTSLAIGARLATHSREFMAGTYNVLDMADLHNGKRTVRWQGLWWRKSSVDRYEEYLLNACNVAPLTLAQLQATRIYVVPTTKDRRLLARLEAFIVHTLCEDPVVGSILDRGYSLAPKWSKEEPIQLRVRGPGFRGLAEVLEVQL